MPRYEYTIKIYSLEELKQSGIDIDTENSIVYACRPGGECEVHRVGIEQLDNLSDILNEMGASGWELIEIIFHQSGIISFWKRQAENGRGEPDREV